MTPVRSPPSASFDATRSASVSRTAIGRAPRIWIAATAGGSTVSSVNEDSLPLRARISAVPGVCARATPVSASTVATGGLLEAQVISAPGSVSPLAPRTSARSGTESPTRSVGERPDGDRGDRKHPRAGPPHGDHDAVPPAAARGRDEHAARADRPDSAGRRVHPHDGRVARRPDDRRAGDQIRPAASRASAARLAVLSGRSERAGRCVMTTATGGELSIPTEPPA